MQLLKKRKDRERVYESIVGEEYQYNLAELYKSTFI